MSKIQDAFFTLVIVLMVLGTAAINQAQAAPTATAVAARGSYKVKGVRYYPLKTAHNFKQTGKASWYGPGFHGKKTSNGERYNMHALTAAHKTLPLGTIVRVRNLANGKSVIVRINDRGPFHGNRIIDLSKAAAGRLDFIRTGMADVRVESLSGKNVLAENDAAEPREIQTAAAPARLVKTSASSSDYLTLAKSVPAHAQGSPLYLALQKFADAAEAQSFLRQTAETLDAARLNYPLSVLQQDGAFQVRIGPFQRREQMDELKQRLAAARRVI